MISPNTQQNFQNVYQSTMTQGYTPIITFIKGGRDSAKNYPVAAGYAVFLIDEENKMFFLKINDYSGMLRPLREFKFEDVTPADQAAFDPSKFVTKEDFNVLLSEIKKMNSGREPRRHNYNPRRNNDGKSYEKSI